METFPFHVAGGHLILTLPGGPALLDTGAPVSMGGNSFELRGRNWGQVNDSVLRLARQHSVSDLRWIIGMDVMRLGWVRINSITGNVSLGDEPLPATRHASSLSLQTGAPVVTLEFSGGRRDAILDTGAAISYASREDVTELHAEKTMEDFHPSLGHFTTPVYTIPVKVCGRSISLRVGVLPEKLALHFEAHFGRTMPWIVGSQFFEGRDVILDFAGHRCIDPSIVRNG